MNIKHEKIAILCRNKNLYFFYSIKGTDIYEYEIANKYSKRIIDHVFLIFKINYILTLKINKQLRQNINHYNKIICLDDGYGSYIGDYIRKKNKKCKVILYFRNVIKSNPYNKNILLDKKINTIYTFDYNDSKKHKINFVDNFIVIKNDKKTTNQISDLVVFVGRNKNRFDTIKKIETNLNKINMKTQFTIIDNENNYIQYDEYIKIVEKCCCILDIVAEDQVGLTLRVLESIFYEKKLITNNKNIANYSFYNKNNIYIIDDNNNEEAKLAEFFRKEYIKYDYETVKEYLFENWIQKIII